MKTNNSPKTNEIESRIDLILASLWSKRSGYEREMDSAKDYVASLLLSREERQSGYVTIDSLRERAAQADGYNGRMAAEYLGRYDNASAAITALDAGTAPVEAVYRSRMWSRFFLVNNSNGHIHSSMQCSTCFIDTDFSWLPELSGLTEAEAVEAYGCILCSVCFPSAPVEWTNGISKADQAAKDERAAAKVEREAAKAAKAITNPDGSILRDAGGYEIKSEVTARRTLGECFFNILLGYEQNGTTKYTEAIDRIAQAIAAKTGEDADTLKAEAKAKAEKKYKKEMS